MKTPTAVKIGALTADDDKYPTQSPHPFPSHPRHPLSNGPLSFQGHEAWLSAHNLTLMGAKITFGSHSGLARQITALQAV